MKKEKLTISQKLDNRKFKIPNRFFYWLILHTIVPIAAKDYKVTYNIKDKIDDCKTGAFIIYNHQSRGEYIWLSHCALPKRINFVVGYNEHFRAKFRLFFPLLRVIPKKNFTTDITAIRGINTIIKQGGVVCFSPEGMSSIVGHNQPIVVGTGNFFKHYNVPVYVCKIKGGYLSNHKVCLDNRKGRVDTEFSLLLKPEDIQKMSGEEIDNLINKEIWQDDYEWQQKEMIKWKTGGNICSHLHDICYKCPKCGEEMTMLGEGNVLKCSHCGNGATMDDYYQFHPFNDECKVIDTPSNWVRWERQLTIQEIRENPNYSYSCKVKIGELPKYKFLTHNKTSELCGEGTITVDHQGVHFDGVRHGEPYKFDLDYKEVATLVIVTDVTFFSLYVVGDYLEFYPDIPCVGKVLLLVEEMHRLHVNKWKNFPWMDYMYKLEEK